MEAWLQVLSAPFSGLKITLPESRRPVSFPKRIYKASLRSCADILNSNKYTTPGGETVCPDG